MVLLNKNAPLDEIAQSWKEKWNKLIDYITFISIIKHTVHFIFVIMSI